MELLIKNIRACDPQTGLDGITDIGIDGGKIVSLGTTDEHAQRSPPQVLADWSCR